MDKRIFTFLFVIAFLLTVGFFLINGRFTYEDISDTEYDDYLLFERFLNFTQIIDDYTSNVTKTLGLFKRTQSFSFQLNPFSEHFGQSFSEYASSNEFEQELQDGLISPPRNIWQFLITVLGPLNNLFYYVVPVIVFVVMNIVYLVQFVYNILVYLFSPIPKWSS